MYFDFSFPWNSGSSVTGVLVKPGPELYRSHRVCEISGQSLVLRRFDVIVSLNEGLIS